MKNNIIVGQKIGRLTVVSLTSGSMGRRAARCLCDCGNECIPLVRDILRGHTKTCGCARAEKNRIRLTTHGMGNSQVREYRAWCHIKDRCYNEASDKFKHYGQRGIVMSLSWKESFTNFLADMGKCPQGFTIERIDNNGNYCASNCRWASQKEQCQNTRRSLFFTHNGETLNLKQWAAKLKINYHVFYRKIKNGISFESVARKARNGGVVRIWERI